MQGRFPQAVRDAVRAEQQQGLRIDVAGSRSSQFGAPGSTSGSWSAGDEVQAWRNDAVCLDGRILKLQRNSGASPTKKRAGPSVQREIQQILAGGGTGESSMLSSGGSGVAALKAALGKRGFGTADEGAVMLSIEFDLAGLCLRKVDELAALVLDVTVGGGSGGGAQAATGPLLRVPSSVLSLADRCLGLSETLKRLQAGTAAAAIPAASSTGETPRVSVGAATAEALAGAAAAERCVVEAEWSARCSALDAKYAAKAEAWKSKGEDLARQRGEAQDEAAHWKARCEELERRAAEAAPEPTSPPAAVAAAEGSAAAAAAEAAAQAALEVAANKAATAEAEAAYEAENADRLRKEVTLLKVQLTAAKAAASEAAKAAEATLATAVAEGRVREAELAAARDDAAAHGRSLVAVAEAKGRQEKSDAVAASEEKARAREAELFAKAEEALVAQRDSLTAEAEQALAALVAEHGAEGDALAEAWDQDRAALVAQCKEAVGEDADLRGQLAAALAALAEANERAEGAERRYEAASRSAAAAVLAVREQEASDGGAGDGDDGDDVSSGGSGGRTAATAAVAAAESRRARAESCVASCVGFLEGAVEAVRRGAQEVGLQQQAAASGQAGGGWDGRGGGGVGSPGAEVSRSLRQLAQTHCLADAALHVTGSGSSGSSGGGGGGVNDDGPWASVDLRLSADALAAAVEGYAEACRSAGFAGGAQAGRAGAAGARAVDDAAAEEACRALLEVQVPFRAT